jgi:hypothetical protein
MPSIAIANRIECIDDGIYSNATADTTFITADTTLITADDDSTI